MDNYHKELLETAKKKYIDDHESDFTILIIGGKGSGKTTFGLQTCWFWDEDFNVEKIVYHSNEFYKKLRPRKEGEALQLDEAVLQQNQWTEKFTWLEDKWQTGQTKISKDTIPLQIDGP